MRSQSAGWARRKVGLSVAIRKRPAEKGRFRSAPLRRRPQAANSDTMGAGLILCKRYRRGLIVHGSPEILRPATPAGQKRRRPRWAYFDSVRRAFRKRKIAAWREPETLNRPVTFGSSPISRPGNSRRSRVPKSGSRALSGWRIRWTTPRRRGFCGPLASSRVPAGPGWPRAGRCFLRAGGRAVAPGPGAGPPAF